jgi:hypothetical protein
VSIWSEVAGQVCTGVCIPRTFATLVAPLTRIAKGYWLGYAVSDGRTWDRTRDLSRVKRALSR